MNTAASLLRNSVFKLLLPVALLVSGCTQQAIDAEQARQLEVTAGAVSEKQAVFAAKSGRRDEVISAPSRTNSRPRPVLVPFDPRPVRRPDSRPVPSPEPIVVFDCAGNASQDTVPEITAPNANSLLGAGTELRWERAGHDYCGGFGSGKRYSIAICRQSTPGNCNPANGFYRANVSPDDLGWEQATPGQYTLSAENIKDVMDNAPATEGQTVYFHIRYNFDAFNTHYGEWRTRAFTFSENAGVSALPDAITQAPQITQPGPGGTYSPYGPFNLSWGSVTGSDYYRVKLVYRRGSPSGSDTGVYNGETTEREAFNTFYTFDEKAPAYTFMVVWVVAACNELGCGPNTIQGVLFDANQIVPAEPQYSFSAIAPAFRAPSCVNCHAVAANLANPDLVDPTDPEESGTNFGLPAGHVAPTGNCTGCHTASLTPGGSHPVPWQAAPASMDLRGKNDFELCFMAKNPGSLAESIEDHLLGDPLILWAINGGQLPQGAGPTNDAFAGDWQQAVSNWVEGGASCNLN